MNKIVLVFLVLILGSLLLAFYNKVSAATFTFSPSVGSFGRACLSTLVVQINAVGESSNAAEIEIDYNPSVITIIDSNPLEAGTQVRPGDAYQAYFYNQVDSINGTIRVAAASFAPPLTTNRTFIEIDFTSAVSATNSNFNIRFDGLGATLDSNIADSSTSNDILTGVTNGSYNFIPSSCSGDTEGPNVIFNFPTNNQQNVPLNSNVSINLTDNSSGVDLSTVEFIVNGVVYIPSDVEVSYSGSPNNYSFTINPSADFPANQASTIVVRASDYSGNFTERQIIFNVPQPVPPAPPPVVDPDRDQPVISFLTPINLQANVEPDSLIQFTVADDGSGINLDSLIIYFNGSEYRNGDEGVTINEGPVTYTVTLIPTDGIMEDAINTLRVVVADMEGNFADRQIIFNFPTVEVTDPESCPSEPSEEQICFGETITVNQLPGLVNRIFQNDKNLFKNTPLEDTVFDQLASDIGVTGVSALGLGLLASIAPILTLLSVPGAILKFFAILLGKKEKNPWGVILDAVTNKPIPFAICQLYVSGSQYKLSQTVSDLEGRYGFIISPGKYRIEVKQSGYETFTKEVEINDQEEIFIYDIKLKPEGYNIKVTTNYFDNTKKFLKNFITDLLNFLFRVGFIFSTVSIIISFSIINLIIFLFYISIILIKNINRLRKKSKFASVVNSKNSLRVPYAQVRVFDPKTWKMIDSQVTSYNGQFDFYGEPGEYAILVSASGYEFPSKMNTYPLSKSKYSGMVLVKLNKGKNKIDLLVDPRGNDDKGSGNLPSPFA